MDHGTEMIASLIASLPAGHTSHLPTSVPYNPSEQATQSSPSLVSPSLHSSQATNSLTGYGRLHEWVLEFSVEDVWLLFCGETGSEGRGFQG
jgi:hypothetical protein